MWILLFVVFVNILFVLMYLLSEHINKLYNYCNVSPGYVIVCDWFCVVTVFLIWHIRLVCQFVTVTVPNCGYVACMLAFRSVVYVGCMAGWL